MVDLLKHERAELNIVREFWPRNPEEAKSGGRLIIRATNYGSSLDRFDTFYELLSQEAASFEPPIEIGRDDVEIVQYGGVRYKGTFGLETSIPDGHVVSDSYTRVARSELTK